MTAASTPRFDQCRASTQSRIIGAALNYGGQLSLYVPHMLRVNMTRDMAHLQLSDLHLAHFKTSWCTPKVG